jgi:hypothetical protein
MSHKFLLPIAGFVGLLAVTSPCGAQPAKSTESAATDKITQSRELFRKGLAAYENGQIDEAHRLFLQVWAIQPSSDTAMELAQTEMDLGQYALATEHLEYAQHNFTPSINDKMRNIARQAYADALKRVGKLRILVNQDGAELFVNGRSVGKSPLPQPVYVDPGNCSVEARLGTAKDTQSVMTEIGKEATVALALHSAQTAQVPVPVPKTEPVTNSPPVTRPPRNERSYVPLVVGGAVAVVGIGAGIGLRLTSNSDDDRAKTMLAGVGIGGCSNPAVHQSECAALSDKLNSVDRARNWSTAGFVVGGAALVGAAIYWFWPRGESSTLRVDGGVGQGVGTIMLKGTL